LKSSDALWKISQHLEWTSAKACISGFPDGLVKLVFRGPDKKLLGVHIVGEVASELVHIGQFVMHEKA
jgi:NAD(P) transhydrogenase